MRPFGFQNPQKSFKNQILRGIKILIVLLLRFLINFGSVLGTKFEPCWPPRRPQDAPGRPQDAPKTPRDAPRRRQDTLRPQEAPRRLQDRFWVDFSLIVGRLLIDCGLFFFEVKAQNWMVCLAFACGLSCNARPPCSRSAGSIIRYI